MLIKIDDNLHGKVYLFYNGSKPKGFMITSGNFTEKGLLNNHEYGLCVEDEEIQKKMADTIMSINIYDLSYIQLCEIYNDALKFIEKHPLINYPGASTQVLCSAPTSPLIALAFHSSRRKNESGV